MWWPIAQSIGDSDENDVENFNHRNISPKYYDDLIGVGGESNGDREGN